MVKIAKKNVLKTKELKFKKKRYFKNQLKKTKFSYLFFYFANFIHPSKRQKMFDKIFKGLNWGGIPFFLKK